MELLKELPNGGAVVAIIAVVILFLRKMEKTEDTVKAAIGSFVTETTSARKEYREHVNEIMKMGLDAHKETRDAIHSLNETLSGIRESRKPQPLK